MERIDDGGVHVEDRSWNKRVLEADYVVNAMGLRPVSAEAFRMLIPEVYVVGDCAGIGTIKKANHSGFDAAMEL